MSDVLTVSIPDGIDVKAEAQRLHNSRKRSQARVLMAVAIGCNDVTSICQRLGVTGQSNVHATIKRLITDGLLVDDGDRAFEDLLAEFEDVERSGVVDIAERREA